ncbi:hypothetical protein UFOVP1307_42 [uncultured Caudovirales phage]|uniref:Uncharacterized protein n=1 Tax=uncultured Caudovirales phage TaxID=2100421 RepID=A0A6J5RUY0_9CAUD|nr:hypothetical protein UFOVP651_81 [uncultured Caudovirales phage]CAB4170987.1 hypothetical protein UFOVP902_160 [uncultured Caudovirales phage]CAB4197986.1 hypothetical protein UFOVP1307_42 [uncultured Caudovirales phage]
MKNTLAENMLRFAPKNLGAKDIKTLKRLAEQGEVAADAAKPQVAIELGESLTYLSGLLNDAAKYTIIPIGKGGVPSAILTKQQAVSYSTGIPNLNFFAANNVTITQDPSANTLAKGTIGTPFVPANIIFPCDIAKGSVPAGTYKMQATKIDPRTNFCEISSGKLVQDQINQIKGLLDRMQIQSRPQSMHACFAKLIMGAQSFLRAGYSDYAAKQQFLNNVATDGKTMLF